VEVAFTPSKSLETYLGKCPYCNSVLSDKTDDENIQDIMKRVEANDAGAICILGNLYGREEVVCCKIGRGP
jgi:uncharacterized protein with PIN domain